MRTNSLAAYVVLSLLLAGSALVACGAGGDGTYASESDDDDDGAEGTPAPGDDDDDGEPTGTPTPPDPGQLTAGDFDDNLNFDWYSQFTEYFDGQFPSYPLYLGMDRVEIRVTNAQGATIPNARVTVTSGETMLFSGPTGTDGRTLYFPERDGGGAQQLAVTVTPLGGAPQTFSPPNGLAWTFEITGGSPALPQALDLAFVVDTTGSMWDEMDYLKAEVDSIADYVEAAFPSVDVRYGLVVYKDDGDEYVAKSWDFSDLQTFRTKLDAQDAGGGGDWPEAIERGLAKAGEMSWRDGNVARVAFLLADAPAHEQYVNAFYDQVDVAREIGIRYYPVASSGTMGDAEYLFRVLGQATLGRFVFLTNDSGLGLEHFDPHIPCFQVQYLNQLIARMIVTELSGTRVEAEPNQVLRTVGIYENGVCGETQPALTRLAQPIRMHAPVMHQ